MLKTIILAAGEGKRLRPLTENQPKPMVKILGKPILEHILDTLVGLSDEVYIVLKYKGEKVKDFFGYNYENIKIHYVWQGDEKGTAAALWNIDLNEDFVVLNGDTIYDKKDLEKIYQSADYACLVKEVDQPHKYGIFKQDENGFAVKIIEKPQEYVGNLANIGVYKFSPEFLKLAKNVKLSQRGEYEITDAINEFIKNHKFKLIKQERPFVDIGYPEDVEKAEKILKTLNKSNV